MIKSILTRIANTIAEQPKIFFTLENDFTLSFFIDNIDNLDSDLLDFCKNNYINNDNIQRYLKRKYKYVFNEKNIKFTNGKCLNNVAITSDQIIINYNSLELRKIVTDLIYIISIFRKNGNDLKTINNININSKKLFINTSFFPLLDLQYYKDFYLSNYKLEDLITRKVKVTKPTFKNLLRMYKKLGIYEGDIKILWEMEK